MTQEFSFTPEEKNHLWELSFWPGPSYDDYGPEYFRFLAQLERDAPSWKNSQHEGPHEDDMDYISADDYEEMADSIECDMDHGEVM